jgi:aromatic-L-amino-acid decarboxylase
MDDQLGDWTPEEFEAHGHEVLALLRDYFAGIETRPVLATTPPGELLALLDRPLPEDPEPFDQILGDTRAQIIPHLTHWNHPGFQAYFANTGSGAGILAETATAAFNVNAMIWRTSPVASALESVVLRWLAQMVGYPPDADGVLINGASLASFYALAAALDATGLNIREEGLAGRHLPRLRLYISDQTHSSLEKAAIALGIGLRNVVKVPSDAQYRMDPAALDALIAADVAAGHRPFAVCATVGTTSTASVDPVGPISAVCRAHNLWLHVDAAYGGFWGLVPEARAASGDLSLGDSLVVNPHKTLYTPMEATAFYCKRKGALRNTFSLVAEYLRTAPDPLATNYMDFSLQLGRSFRALKLWWVIRTFGVAGLRRRMAEHIRLARALEAWITADPDWRVLSASPYPLVCLQALPAAWRAPYADPALHPSVQQAVDRLNAAIMERINTAGHSFISHTVLREGYTLRVSIGNIRTEERHIRGLWAELRTALADMMRET